MTYEQQSGFVRREGLIVTVLLLVSLAVLGWVFVQMRRHDAAEQARQATAAPRAASARTPAVSAHEAPATANTPPAGNSPAAKTNKTAVPAPPLVLDPAAVAVELEMYSNTIATLKVQLDLAAQTHQHELTNVSGALQEQLRALREDMARHQTQACLAEHEVVRSHLHADAAREALERAQAGLRARDAEILRLRQMIEDLSGIETPMLQPASVTNAAVESVAPASLERIGAAAPGVMRAPEVEASEPPSLDKSEDQPARSGWQPRSTPAAGGTARPARQIFTSKPAPADAPTAVPARVTHVRTMPVTDSADVTTEISFEEHPRDTPSQPALAGAADGGLQTERTEPGVPHAPPQPDFAPEQGARPSMAGMLNGSYRIVCAPFMVPYGIVSGAAVPLRDDPEQGGTTNYVAYGAVHTLALPFSMGFNSIAGAGSGSMDALQGCLDILSLGTYSGTDAQPCIMQVLDEEY